jgi:hypothetical protein
LRPKAKTVNENSDQKKATYKKFINSKNLLDPKRGTDSKSRPINKNNNNNNDERHQNESSAAKGLMKNKLFRYLISDKLALDRNKKQKNVNNNNSNNKTRRIELDDDVLIEMNKNFSSLLTVRFAEASVFIKYLKQANTISIILSSICNLSEHDLERVNFLTDVFYKKKFRNRMASSLQPFSMRSKEKRRVSFEFLIEMNPRIDVNLIKLNVLIVGKECQKSTRETGSEKDVKSEGLVLISRSASEIQILGGVTINVKDYLERFHD